MDKYLKYDVLIGREILGQGFGNEFVLYKINTVNMLFSIKNMNYMDSMGIVI